MLALDCMSIYAVAALAERVMPDYKCVPEWNPAKVPKWQAPGRATD